MTYGETLSSLFERTARGIKLGLDSTRALLDALGNPEQELGTVVLVAGTNGKGSTATLIAGALEAAGHRVGLFTSPHLLQFSERIRVGRQLVAPGRVGELYDAVRAVEDRCRERPTFFECATVMAVKHFAEARVDATVLEVGLGGRLDATNAVPHDVAVITPIALDHQTFLGAEIDVIAAEKAAIIPENGSVVMAPQVGAANAVIAARAEAASARLVHAPGAAVTDSGLLLDGADFGEPQLLTSWPRVAFQVDNVATAAATCRLVAEHGLACPPRAVAQAAASFRWPGRYHWIDGAVDVLVDGGHNVAATLALRRAMENDGRAAGRPMHWVFSALRDKPAAEMVESLRGRFRSLHVCPLPSHRSRSIADLAALDRNATAYHNVAAALDGARDLAARDGGLVLASGSLLLAGDVLALLTHAPRDPATRF